MYEFIWKEFVWCCRFFKGSVFLRRDLGYGFFLFGIFLEVLVIDFSKKKKSNKRYINY